MTLPALEVGVAVRGDTDQTVQVVGGGRVLAALRGLEPLRILLWNVSKVRLRAKHEQASAVHLAMHSHECSPSSY